MEVPDFKSLNCTTCGQKYIASHYHEFFSYINKHYPIELKWTEKLYWFYNNIDKHPTCCVCGKHTHFKNIFLGYTKTCSHECSRKDPSLMSKMKQTCIKKYGVENYGMTKECHDRMKQTCLEKYGVDSPFKLEKVQKKIKQTCLDKYGYIYPNQNKEIHKKSEQTCLERYGVKNPFELEDVKERIKRTNFNKYGAIRPSCTYEIKNKVKQTCLEKYGVENYAQTDEYKIFIKENSPKIQKKIYETRKRNNSFRSSKIEKQFEQWLVCNKINYIKEYKCKEYPFKCDFYFPDKNLYLEIQGFWSHGGHPYNPNDKGDLEKANKWKEKGTKLYLNNYNVWTIKDPLKRETAIKNNLNWIEVFTSDIDVLLDKVKDIL